MAHDVFISYSSKDKTVADAVTAKLEALGVRCWVAPRDILPGRDWGEAIIDGIEESKVMVLVFSQHANESVQIKREVERSVNKGHPIIPFRIEDVQPTKSLEYFISSQHWLDALTPDLEGHLDYLGETVNLILSRAKNDGSALRPFPKPPAPKPKLTPKQLGVLAVLVLAGLFAAFTFNRGNPELDSVFIGDWHQENQAAGFTQDITIDDDGNFKNNIIIEEKGDYSYNASGLHINGFGGERLSGWQIVGGTSVKAPGLIPNNIWGFITFAAPQAAQGNQIFRIATEALFSHTAGPGKAPRYPAAEVDSYEYQANLGGIPWKFTAEFGPGNSYHFAGTMADSGKFRAKDGKWTFASGSGNVTSGTYQVLDKSSVSMTSILGPGVWKRK